MADNYIERQYEQYEARKAAWEKKRKQGKKKTISVKSQPKDLTDNTIKLPRKAFITGGCRWHREKHCESFLQLTIPSRLL